MRGIYSLRCKPTHNDKEEKLIFYFLFFFFFCTLLLRSAVDVPTPLVVCSGWKKLTEYDNIIMISFRGQNNKTRSCTLYLLSIRSKPYCYTALILLQSHEYIKKKNNTPNNKWQSYILSFIARWRARKLFVQTFRQVHKFTWSNIQI